MPEKTKNFIIKNKRTIMYIAMIFCTLFLSTTDMFAEGIAVLDTAGEKILSLISAKWVKALLVVALVIEFGAVAFGAAQGEGGIIKKVLPWILGTAGILGATSIVNFFFSGIEQENLSYIVRQISTSMA